MSQERHQAAAELLKEALAQGRNLEFEVKSGSMFPSMPKGTALRLSVVEPSELRFADIVVFRQGDELWVHRYFGLVNDSRCMRTKGDWRLRFDPRTPVTDLLARVEAYARVRGKWRPLEPQLQIPIAIVSYGIGCASALYGRLRSYSKLVCERPQAAFRSGVAPIVQYARQGLSSVMNRLVLANPALSAKRVDLIPREDGLREIPPIDQREALPPRELWEGYGADAASYLASGEQHVHAMCAALRELGADPADFGRVLEFGAAAGRMIRHLPSQTDAELWAVDIKERSIDWAQRNLGPAIRFINISTVAHLPFEDRSFDLVFAGSVFTHIDEQADAWFLELLRCTKPSGWLYITIQDRHSISLLRGELKDLLPEYLAEIDHWHAKTGVLDRPFGCFSFLRGQWSNMPVAQVFYDLDYLRHTWGSFADLRAVRKGAYGHQTALLFQKRVTKSFTTR